MAREKDPAYANSLTFWEIAQKTFIAADLSFSRSLAVCSDGGLLRPLMKTLEWSCHGLPWIISAVYVFLDATNPPLERVMLNLLCALFIDLVIVGVIKWIVRRKRPSYNRDDMFATVSVDKFSFPSGHATRAYMVTWFLLYHVKLAIPLRFLLQVWCHAVGASRVVLGRHHITDVLAGFAIGYMEFLLIEKIWISDEQTAVVAGYIKPLWFGKSS